MGGMNGALVLAGAVTIAIFRHRATVLYHSLMQGRMVLINHRIYR
jgi:hypothetical protein